MATSSEKNKRGKYTCTKQYFNLPCAHRQHQHDGHCSKIHGYSRSFKFYFACNDLDSNHFVFDFGKLHKLKEHLDYMCDHTLLINRNDPFLEKFKEMDHLGICQLRIVESCSAEGMARYFFDFANLRLAQEVFPLCSFTKSEK